MNRYLNVLKVVMIVFLFMAAAGMYAQVMMPEEKQVKMKDGTSGLSSLSSAYSSGCGIIPFL